jgi:hypothetical protein
MLKAGEMQEIADQIVDSQIHIVALQEIRWRGYGLLKKDEYSLYYNCDPVCTGQAGTRFIIQKPTMKEILRFKPISYRICKLRAEKSTRPVAGQEQFGSSNNITGMCLEEKT